MEGLKWAHIWYLEILKAKVEYYLYFLLKHLYTQQLERGIGFPIKWFLGVLGVNTYIGIGVMILLGLLGFIIGTFKVPDSGALKVTRLVGGENIDDVILRYIKFKQKKNRIYITKEEDITDGE